MPFYIETIQSECLQAEVPFAVILPEGEGPFPVLYDLHGLMNEDGPYDPAPTPREFFEKLAFRTFQRIADESGTAIVKVNGGRGWYLDSPRISGSQVQSHIVDELFQCLEKKFPIIGNAAGRGLSGHSMGGFGVINLLCRYPEMFSVGATHCASLRFSPLGDPHGSYIEDLMTDEQQRAAFPEDFLQGLVRNDLKLRITVGVNDKERIVRGNRDLHRFLLQCNQLHVYEETPGGHEYIPHGLAGVRWAAEQLGKGCTV